MVCLCLDAPPVNHFIWRQNLAVLHLSQSIRKKISNPSTFKAGSKVQSAAPGPNVNVNWLTASLGCIIGGLIGAKLN